MLGPDLSGQRDVGRDDQIARLHQFDDPSWLVTSVGCGVPMVRLPNRVYHTSYTANSAHTAPWSDAAFAALVTVSNSDSWPCVISLSP